MARLAGKSRINAANSQTAQSSNRCLVFFEQTIFDNGITIQGNSDPTSPKITMIVDYFTITYNTNFLEVIRHCATVERNGQLGTWITNDMINAYDELNKKGYAQSVEVWLDNKLVGGLYGINLQEEKIFCGESMFSLERDASKVALFHLVEKLKLENYQLIDCQMYTRHLENLGAEEISRKDFKNYLKSS